ncbi:MAG: hypothetical protein ABI823_05510 [Bryobacteraceae bacterium]
MPFQASPPPAIEYAAVPQERLFDALRRKADVEPGQALDLAFLVKNELRRDQLRKQAFLSACARDRKSAARHLPSLIDLPWVEEVPLFDAVALAAELSDKSLARRLCMAVTMRNPSLAVRAAADYVHLPFGNRMFEAGALAVPGDAVLVASGNSPSAQDALARLDASGNRDLQFLAMLARRKDVDPALKERAAAFHTRILSGGMTLDRAIEIAAKPAAYFHELVEMRLAADRTAIRTLDRMLEAQALPMARSMNTAGNAARSTDLRAMTARDVFLLLAYGRAEEGEAGFAAIFDHALLPRLRSERLSVLRMLETMRFLQFRPFIAAALANERLDAFLAASGDSERGRVVAAFVDGLDRSDQPLADLVSAAEIVQNVAPITRLRHLALAISEQSQRAESRQAKSMYGLLAALADARLGGADGPWKTVAGPYKWALAGIDTLLRAPLFPREQLCVERHFFYDDADGVDSYESFRATYEADKAWKIADQDGWVRLTGESDGRRIEIFANVPINLNTSANAGDSDESLRRQQRVSKALTAASYEPAVVVHRGHSYHVDKTLDYLNSSARLVFLGSCHGMGKMDIVMERAPGAQVIATRGIGTASINDPMLKSLNDALLRGTGDVRWPDFWKVQKSRFGGSRTFAEYVPPHQNVAAEILRAYYAVLDGQAPSTVAGK